MALPNGERERDGIGGSDDDAIVTEEEFALTGEERLPWLESDDDYEQPGVDTGRIIAFAAAGLIVLAAIIGGLWWATSDRTTTELVADGSTIEAPDEPYRERPENPGGRQVAGTGDSSFEVAEGATVETRIADAPAPAPSIDLRQESDEGETAGSSTQGVGVQVGAYSTRAAAEAGWSTLVARLEPLRDRRHRIVEGLVDGSTIFRLQAVGGTAAEADQLCRAIKTAGGDCQVKR